MRREFAAVASESKGRRGARAKDGDGGRYWLLKSEPEVYSFAKLVEDGRTVWEGVRNFEARNNLRAMREGDLALYYHSGRDKSVVGTARIVRSAYPDPTARDEDWSVVDVAPEHALATPVALAAIRSDPAFSGFALLVKPRLSVVPVEARHFEKILALGEGAPPGRHATPARRRGARVGGSMRGA